MQNHSREVQASAVPTIVSVRRGRRRETTGDLVRVASLTESSRFDGGIKYELNLEMLCLSGVSRYIQKCMCNLLYR